MKIQLRITGAAGVDQSASFDVAEVVIGRDPDVTLAIPDTDSSAEVSAIHMRLLQCGNDCIAEDLDSTNGTWLNGARLNAGMPVRENDRFRLGVNGPTVEIASLSVGSNGNGTKLLVMLAATAMILCLIVITVSVWPSQEMPLGSAQEDDVPSLSSSTDMQRRRSGLSPPSVIATRRDAADIRVGGEVIVDVLANDGNLADRDRLVLKSVGNSQLGAQVAIGANRQSIRYSSPIRSGRDRIAYEVAHSRTDERGKGTLEIVVRLVPRDLTRYEESVVWVGFRYIDEIHADECGWFVAPDKVVTSGRAATALKNLAEAVAEPSMLELIVHFRGKFLPVRSVTVHNGYQEENPGDRNSLQRDLGLLVLSQPVTDAVMCSVGKISGHTEPSVPSLRMVWFQNETKITDLYDATRVKLTQSEIAVVGSETGTLDSSLILKTASTFHRGMAGAPVFDDTAAVVGVASQYEGRLVIVPAQPVEEMLK